MPFGYWGPTPVNEAMAKGEQLDCLVELKPIAVCPGLRYLGGLQGLIGEFEAGRENYRRSREDRNRTWPDGVRQASRRTLS